MLLYNILTGMLFLVSLCFFIFISVDSKKKYGDFGDQKHLLSWVNMREKKTGPIQLNPSKWYNKFTE